MFGTELGSVSGYLLRVSGDLLKVVKFKPEKTKRSKKWVRQESKQENSSLEVSSNTGDEISNEKVIKNKLQNYLEPDSPSEDS